jgi:ankyrin repeat protein
VAAGYGWSWDEEECGTYVNIDCHHPSSSTLDTRQDEHSSSNYESSINTDDEPSDSSPHTSTASDDDDFISDDDDDELPIKSFSWADTEATTHIWSIINRADYSSLQQLLEHDEDVVRYRSMDGRGALWWAYEYGHEDIVDLLIAHGADQDAQDVAGKRPVEMRQGGHEDL